MNIILVPVDFSPVTNRVVEVAAQIAQWEQAEIVLIHATDVRMVTPTPYWGTHWFRGAVGAAERTAKDKLRRLARRIAQHYPAVRWMHAKGRPADVVVAQARANDTRAIVIGSHGHGALYDLFAGSTTQAVLQRAGCPVVVVPDRPARTFGRGPGQATPTILAALDNSKMAPRVCATAAAIAQKAGGRVLLLHVRVPPAVSLPPMGFAAAEVRTMLRELEHRATSRARRLLLRCRQLGLRAQLLEKRAEAAPCILTQARLRRAAYIVIGSNAHGAAYDLLVGSTAQQVVRSAPCPVILVSARARSGARGRNAARAGRAT